MTTSPEAAALFLVIIRSCGGTETCAGGLRAGEPADWSELMMAAAFSDYGHADEINRMRRLRRLSAIARLMDTAVAIPFTGIRFGADSVLGLAPGLGDAAGAAVALIIVNEARRLGVPNRKLVSMLLNIGIDTFGGSVPILGDLFDVYFKSNRRNVDIVLDHFGMTRADLERARS